MTHRYVFEFEDGVKDAFTYWFEEDGAPPHAKQKLEWAEVSICTYAAKYLKPMGGGEMFVAGFPTGLFRFSFSGQRIVELPTGDSK